MATTPPHTIIVILWRCMTRHAPVGLEAYGVVFKRVRTLGFRASLGANRLRPAHRFLLNFDFAVKPFVNGFLVIISRSADLRKKPNLAWLFRRDVFGPLIACGTKGSEIGQFIFAPKCFVFDMPYVQSDRPVCRRIYFPRGQTAHLACKPVPVKHFRSETS